MSIELNVDYLWVPQVLGGHQSAPYLRMRPTIRWQRYIMTVHDRRRRVKVSPSGGVMVKWQATPMTRPAGWRRPPTPSVGRTSLFYDGADRLLRPVLPGGREIAFDYDSSGNVTGVTRRG
jgi:YD repeat-containing protein